MTHYIEVSYRLDSEEGPEVAHESDIPVGNLMNFDNEIESAIHEWTPRGYELTGDLLGPDRVDPTYTAIVTKEQS